MAVEALVPGVVTTIPASTIYALPPGPHRVLFSTSNAVYATTVDGTYNAITNPNVEPGPLYESGFIKNNAGGPRLVIVKKITRLDTFAGKVAQSNPYAYYRLGEKSGTTLYDSMGNALNLTKGSTVTLGVTGPLGDGNTGVTLDGTNNSVSNSSAVSPWTGWTAISFEQWVYGPAWAATHEVTISLGGVGIYYSVNSAQPFMSIHTGSQFTCTALTTVPINTWTHLAATWESGDMIRHYVNGVAITTNNTNTRSGSLSASATLYIGAFAGTAIHYSGTLDEVVLYNRKLSASEVMQHYSARNVK